jgi:hypothetical protein
MEPDGFDKWLDKAVELRDTLKFQLDHIASGNPIWAVPTGMTKEEWIEALKGQIDSLSQSLKNFGR